jgi:hypothetical protein
MLSPDCQSHRDDFQQTVQNATYSEHNGRNPAREVENTCAAPAHVVPVFIGPLKNLVQVSWIALSFALSARGKKCERPKLNRFPGLSRLSGLRIWTVSAGVWPPGLIWQLGSTRLETLKGKTAANFVIHRAEAVVSS